MADVLVLQVKYKNLACSKSPEEMNDEADRYLQVGRPNISGVGRPPERETI